MLCINKVISEKDFMMKLFAKKIGMTHIYDQSGAHVPVTVAEVQKTVFCRRKTKLKDGYDALVFAKIAPKSSRKSLNNQFSAVSEAVSKVSELRFSKPADENTKYDDGAVMDSSTLAEGDEVEIRAKSKGKGFQGTVKRHGFTTGPKTHGSHNYRAPGSIGSTNPDRTVKGKKMPGHMGCETVTIKNIKIVRNDPQKNYLYLRGSIPGAANSIIEITKND